MATYGGSAWVDVAAGADVDSILDWLRAGEPTDRPLDSRPELYALVERRAEHTRIDLACHGSGYDLVADLTVALMRTTDLALRAFVALDHDEYGAEHAVLAKRDGAVVRLQHVFVYPRYRLGLWPYRAGVPWRTEVPAGVPSSGSRWWGHLVYGRRARAAVGELYGVPPERIRRAVREARRSHEDLQVVQAPFRPWLQALGIAEPVGEGAAQPVKLWPGPVWREAAERYAVPRLPGRWLVRDDQLVREPVGLVYRGVARSGSGLYVFLHPLYLPLDTPDNFLQPATGCDIRGVWKPFATVEDGEPYMDRLVEVVRERVVSYLEENGTPEGYAAMCQRSNAGSHANPHVLYRQAASEIVLGRYAGAAASLAAVRRFADQDRQRVPWLAELAGRADALRERLDADPDGTRAALLAGVGEQRRRLGLAATDD